MLLHIVRHRLVGMDYMSYSMPRAKRILMKSEGRLLLASLGRLLHHFLHNLSFLYKESPDDAELNVAALTCSLTKGKKMGDAPIFHTMPTPAATIRPTDRLLTF
jgi:hypothetical protein